MAHTVVIYSEPVSAPKETLRGNAKMSILGYRNIAISHATNVLRADIQSALFVPAGFFADSDPTVSPLEPKGMLYEVSLRSVCFSQQPMGAVIRRERGSQPGYSG